MRLRLIAAATQDNVSELERLRGLDMATCNDYRAGIHCAIAQGSFASAMHLWQCLAQVPGKEDDAVLESLPHDARLFYRQHRPSDCEFDSEDQELRLLFMVLEAVDSTWTLQLARYSPSWFLYALNKYCTQHSSLHTATYTNLRQLVRDKTIFLVGSNERAQLLTHVFALECACEIHPWQGVQAFIRELCNDPDAVDVDLFDICEAVDRCPNGVEECATLCMLLDQRDAEYNTDELLEWCCENTKTGVPMRLLLDHLDIADTEGTYVSLASQCGSTAAIEACLDRPTVVLDMNLSDCLLLHIVQNKNARAESRALAHVLERIFGYASIEGVQKALENMSYIFYRHKSNISHALRSFLIERLAHCNGWSVAVLRHLNLWNFLWLLQRNPAAVRALLPRLPSEHAVWANNFFAQQAPIRETLVNYTPLAEDIIGLVLQYV
jgi:hypothetical protein